MPSPWSVWSQALRWGFVVLSLGGLGFALLWVEVQHIRREPISSWTLDNRADCGVVLTGGAGRVREGIGLLARGSVRKLVISGVNPHVGLRDMVGPWTLYGVEDTSSIVLEKRSSTTYGNAQQTWPLLEALGCGTVLLITSATHMPRALATFKAAVLKTRDSGEWTIPITPHAVAPGPNETGLLDEWLEATKALFYRIWAF